MEYLILMLLLGGLMGAGLMLWLGFRNAKENSGENRGDKND